MSASTTPQFVQAVRDAVDLVDLVAEHTRLEKRGDGFHGLCPFHKEKTPSFSVDPERGLYYCFGCGAGGDAIGFFMRMTGDDFPAAIESLARRYGVPMPEGGGRSSSAVEERVLELAEAFFVAALARSPSARGYLEKRAIPQNLITEFRLGFAPEGWTGLLDELSKQAPVASLEQAGLTARSSGGRVYDRFRNRLMFPIRTPAGRLVGFGGRTLGDDRAKYLNTRETASFKKGALLYGLDRARSRIQEGRRLLLVEGYFDLLAAVAVGVDWVVASMGTALTLQQARLAKRYADEVVIGYDGDRAGEEASTKALRLLLAEGLTVRRARFPAGQDPDSLRLEEGPAALAQRIEDAADAVELEIERVPQGVRDEPRVQAQAAAQIQPLLLAIPDPVLRFGYSRRAAHRLGVPEELLLRSPTAAASGAVESAQRAPEVTSLEEVVLQRLLNAEVPVPFPLPDLEAFSDPPCREIYRAYCEAAAERGAGMLEARAVIERLEQGGGAIDRFARILKDPPQPMPEELCQDLGRLDLRWKKRRSRWLKGELLAAQSTGDDLRLAELLELKSELNRELYGPAPERSD